MGKGSRRVLFGFSTLAALAIFGAPALAQEGIPACPQNPDHICMTFKPGDTVGPSSGLTVIYERADIGTSFATANNGAWQANDGYSIVVVQLTVTNNSKNDLQVTRSMFTVALPSDMISANNPGTGNVEGDSEYANRLPVSPFPDPVPNQYGEYNSAVVLHPGNTTRGRLAFEVPANYNGALRLLCAFPDPQAQVHPLLRGLGHLTPEDKESPCGCSSPCSCGGLCSLSQAIPAAACCAGFQPP